MAAFGQLFYCIGNSVGIPYTAKASKLAGMRTAAYNVDVASDRRRRKNVPRYILCYGEALCQLNYWHLQEIRNALWQRF